VIDSHTDEQPVLVAGASGFVGSHIVRQLVRQGRRVRAMFRKTSNTRAVQDLNVEIVYGDVLEPATLRSAMQGCSTVFYSVLDPRFWLSDTTPLYRNNVEGLINAMDVALECGVQRFIFTSTMGTLGFNPDGPVTEDIEFNWADRASAYIRARKQAEDELLRYCREKSLPAISLCIANTYGPEDFGPTPHGKMLADVGAGRATRTTDSSAPSVDVRDAAQAALLAEQYGRVGERYIIANEYISNREFFGIATELSGQPPLKVVPLWLAGVVASVAECIFKLTGRKDYLLSRDAVFLSNCFKELDNGKARRELHWNPRPIRETIQDALAWYAEHDAEINSE